ncbi:hypothetical protein ACJJTC_004492 [Scirpophaga incertulas]
MHRRGGKRIRMDDPPPEYVNPGATPASDYGERSSQEREAAVAVAAVAEAEGERSDEEASEGARSPSPVPAKRVTRSRGRGADGVGRLAESPPPPARPRRGRGRGRARATRPPPPPAPSPPPVLLPGDDENSLYNILRFNKAAINQVVDMWIEEYKTNRESALVQLMQFFINSSGCRGKVTPDMAQMDHTLIIKKMTQEFDEESGEYPLIMSGQTWKKFRSNFCEFIQTLVKMCQYSIIYDQYLMDNIISLLTGLSDSQVRAFRHTATLAVMKLMTALVDVALLTSVNCDNCLRQYEAERLKARDRRASDRLEVLVAKRQELEENMEEIKNMLSYMFKSVFVHRYRDTLPDIRAITMTEIGSWMEKFPANFLDDLYLKYIGWTLHDKVGEVRLRCLQALQPLYECEELKGKLELFTSKFKDRIVAMALDKEAEVAVHAVRLVIAILKMHPDVLTDKDCENVYELVYSSSRGVAAAAGEFLNVRLFRPEPGAPPAPAAQRSRRGKQRLPNTPLLRDLVQFFIESELHEHGAYLVDSLIESNPMMKDWECMTDLLLEEAGPGEEALDNRQESSLIELMVCCVRQAATGEPPVGRAAPRRHHHPPSKEHLKVGWLDSPALMVCCVRQAATGEPPVGRAAPRRHHHPPSKEHLKVGWLDSPALMVCCVRQAATGEPPVGRAAPRRHHHPPSKEHLKVGWLDSPALMVCCVRQAATGEPPVGRAAPRRHHHPPSKEHLKVGWLDSPALMVCCVRQAATGEPPVGRAAPRRHHHPPSKEHLKAVAEDRSKMTAHFIGTLPALLDKFGADPEKLTNLVSIPQYFDLELYTTQRQEGNLTLLLNKIREIVNVQTEAEVVEACGRTLEYLCGEQGGVYTRCNVARATVTDACVARYREAADDWRSLLEGGETPDADEIFNVVNSLRKVSIMYMCHNLNDTNIWDSLFEDLPKCVLQEQPSLMPEEALVYVVRACFYSLVWSLHELEERLGRAGAAPLEAAATLRCRLHAFCDVCRQTVRTPAAAALRQEAYISLCDVLVIFAEPLSARHHAGEPLMKELVYEADGDLCDLLNGFVQEVVFVHNKYDGQDERRIEELHKRRNFLAAYCKLIVYNIAPVRRAADVFKHYIKCYNDYGDIIKATLSKAREINKLSCALTMQLAMQALYTDALARLGTATRAAPELLELKLAMQALYTDALARLGTATRAAPELLELKLAMQALYTDALARLGTATRAAPELLELKLAMQALYTDALARLGTATRAAPELLELKLAMQALYTDALARLGTATRAAPELLELKLAMQALYTDALARLGTATRAAPELLELKLAMQALYTDALARLGTATRAAPELLELKLAMQALYTDALARLGTATRAAPELLELKLAMQALYTDALARLGTATRAAPELLELKLAMQALYTDALARLGTATRAAPELLELKLAMQALYTDALARLGTATRAAPELLELKLAMQALYTDALARLGTATRAAPELLELKLAMQALYTDALARLGTATRAAPELLELKLAMQALYTDALARLGTATRAAPELLELKNREALTALHRAGIAFAAADLDRARNLLFLEALAEFSPKLLRQDKRQVLKFLDMRISAGVQWGEEWAPLSTYRASLLTDGGDERPPPPSRRYVRRRKYSLPSVGAAQHVPRLAAHRRRRRAAPAALAPLRASPGRRSARTAPRCSPTAATSGPRRPRAATCVAVSTLCPQWAPLSTYRASLLTDGGDERPPPPSRRYVRRRKYSLPSVGAAQRIPRLAAHRRRRRAAPAALAPLRASPGRRSARTAPRCLPTAATSGPRRPRAATCVAVSTLCPQWAPLSTYRASLLTDGGDERPPPPSRRYVRRRKYSLPSVGAAQHVPRLAAHRRRRRAAPAALAPLRASPTYRASLLTDGGDERPPPPSRRYVRRRKYSLPSVGAAQHIPRLAAHRRRRRAAPAALAPLRASPGRRSAHTAPRCSPTAATSGPRRPRAATCVAVSTLCPQWAPLSTYRASLLTDGGDERPPPPSRRYVRRRKYSLPSVGAAQHVPRLAAHRRRRRAAPAALAPLRASPGRRSARTAPRCSPTAATSGPRRPRAATCVAVSTLCPQWAPLSTYRASLLTDGGDERPPPPSRRYVRRRKYSLPSVGAAQHIPRLAAHRRRRRAAPRRPRAATCVAVSTLCPQWAPLSTYRASLLTDGGDERPPPPSRRYVRRRKYSLPSVGAAQHVPRLAAHRRRRRAAPAALAPLRASPGRRSAHTAPRCSPTAATSGPRRPRAATCVAVSTLCPQWAPLSTYRASLLTDGGDERPPPPSRRYVRRRKYSLPSVGAAQHIPRLAAHRRRRRAAPAALAPLRASPGRRSARTAPRCSPTAATSGPRRPRAATCVAVSTLCPQWAPLSTYRASLLTDGGDERPPPPSRRYVRRRKYSLPSVGAAQHVPRLAAYRRRRRAAPAALAPLRASPGRRSAHTAPRCSPTAATSGPRRPRAATCVAVSTLCPQWAPLGTYRASLLTDGGDERPPPPSRRYVRRRKYSLPSVGAAQHWAPLSAYRASLLTDGGDERPPPPSRRYVRRRKYSLPSVGAAQHVPRLAAYRRRRRAAPAALAPLRASPSERGRRGRGCRRGSRSSRHQRPRLRARALSSYSLQDEVNSQHVELHSEQDEIYSQQDDDDSEQNTNNLQQLQPYSQQLQSHAQQLVPYSSQIQSHSQQSQPYSRQLQPYFEQSHFHSQQLQSHSRQLRPSLQQLHVRFLFNDDEDSLPPFPPYYIPPPPRRRRWRSLRRSTTPSLPVYIIDTLRERTTNLTDFKLMATRTVRLRVRVRGCMHDVRALLFVLRLRVPRPRERQRPRFRNAKLRIVLLRRHIAVYVII